MKFEQGHYLEESNVNYASIYAPSDKMMPFKSRNEEIDRGTCGASSALAAHVAHCRNLHVTSLYRNINVQIYCLIFSEIAPSFLLVKIEFHFLGACSYSPHQFFSSK